MSAQAGYVGYARVSTRDQNPESQVAELEAAGCGRIFVDHGASSRTADRPEWQKCLDYLRPGDTLVIRALDRIAGTEVLAIQTLHELGAAGIAIHSLTEPALNVDPSTPMGRAVLSFMAAIAQLRVDMIRENTMRGLAHARSEGRVGGRPTVMTPQRVEAARQMLAAGKSYREIGDVLGVGRSTVHRALTR